MVLSDGKNSKAYLIHRLVAQEFIPNPNKLPEVNHKNRDITDNSVSNLEWISSEQNIEHSLLEREALIKLYSLANNVGVSPSDMLITLVDYYINRKER